MSTVAMSTVGSSLADVAAKSGEAVKSGPWGLAIILLLCVACYFLFKSMSKHLRRVREQFPTRQVPGPDGRPAPPPSQQTPRPEQPPGSPATPPADPPA
jgi:hypothetical protein